MSNVFWPCKLQKFQIYTVNNIWHMKFVKENFGHVKGALSVVQKW